MADLSITAASVLAGAGAVVEEAVAAATLVAGKAVYQTDTDWRVGLADCNAASAIVRSMYGITLNGGADWQPVKVLRSGLITIGATLVPGVAYYLSATPGGICPVGDLSTGMYPTFIGIAVSSTVLRVNITASGVALA